MDGSSSKETSSRRSCREGNRPQPLEVASLLKLAATNVLFPVTVELITDEVDFREFFMSDLQFSEM
ncbi:MAG: hypothetical protein ACK5A1_22315, partial [Planctomyces sp.]